MISYFQAIILGLMQGATELFPVSSLGHSVILPQLLGWNLDQQNNYFLIFLVATHLATSLVLLVFFFNDWVLIIQGVFRSLKEREIKPDDTYARLGWLIVVSTIPAGIFGLLFEEKLKMLFAVPLITSIVLIINGIFLLSFELYKKIKGQPEYPADSDEQSDNRIAKLTWPQSIKVGFAQSFALIPGFSRTGVTLGGGLSVGLNHEDAARFSFLLATPIIFAAAVLKLPELLTEAQGYAIGPILAGSITSAIAAYISVKFLTRYFKSKNLLPFGIYCMVAGFLSTILFLFR